MTIEHHHEVEALQRIGRIVAVVLQKMLDAVAPPISPLKTRLCHATRTALGDALKRVRDGRPLNGIGAAIEQAAQKHGFRVIENLSSHGVGRALHEAPEQILGDYDPADRRMLKEGMVITIEPFLSTRSRRVVEAADGWTLVEAHGNISAQFEHTLIVTRGEPIVVTRI
jgi:methionyl aminopeptidase